MQKLKELFQGANKERNIMILSGLLILVIISAVYLARPDNKLVTDSPEPDILMERIHESVSNLAYPFVENKGQINNGEAVRFYAPTMAGTMYVTDNEISYAVNMEKENIDEIISPDMEKAEKIKKIADNTTVHAISEKLLDPNGEAIAFNLSPEEKSQTKVSYFIGSSTADWKNDIATYKFLSLGQVWPKTEVKLRAQGNNIEKLFIVEEGGNPNDIKLAMSGIDGLKLRDNGELSIRFKDGELRMTNPVAYQYNEKQEKEYVPVKYAIADDEKSYGFEVNQDLYDKNKTLVIDPLLASTFIGGSADERQSADPISRNIYTGHYAIVDDTNGDVYLIGHSQSNDYPTTAGVYDQTYNDAISPLKNDVVISKFNAELTQLLASTYIGGSSEDTGAAIDLHNGSIYIAGYTISNNFPVTDNSLFLGGGYDGFVAKLSADLSTLSASTYFIGDANDYIYSLTVDKTNNQVIIAGSTNSDYLGPNTVNSRSGVKYNAFISKYDANLSNIVATRFIGGTNEDYGRMVKLDNDNNIILVGKTNSADFPVTAGSYQTALAGSFDAFIAIVANDLSAINAATYLGGAYPEDEFSVDILANNNIVVAGQTKSGDFPTTAGAMDTTHNTGNYDGFVSILNPTLTTLAASTFLGGNYLDEIYELKVDGNDWIYVGGYTNSTDFQSNNTMSGTADGFIARLNQNLTATDFTSTFLGGAGALDYVLSLDTTIDNQLMVFGITNSADFPTTHGAYDETYNGGRDMYLAKMTKDLSVDQTPSHVKITRDSDSGSNMNAIAGATTTQIRISIMDIYNIPIYIEHGDRTVNLSGLANAPSGVYTPKCKDKNGSYVNLGANMTLNFNRGTSTTDCIFYAKETASLDGEVALADATVLDSHGNVIHDLDINVLANSNISSDFSKIDATVDPILADQTQTVTLTTYDIYKNQMGTQDTGQAVNIFLTEDSANDPQSFNGLINNNGVYSATYTYANAGIDKVEATVNGQAVGSDTDPSAISPYDGDNGIRHITAINHLELTMDGANSATMAASDTNKTLTITAKGTTGDTVAGYNGNKILRIYTTATSSPNGTVAKCGSVNLGSNTTLTFTNGVATCILYQYKAGSDIKIDAVDISQTGLNTFTDLAHKLTLSVNPGIENYYTVSGNKRNMRAGDNIKISINTFDAYGNAKNDYSGSRNIIFSGVNVSLTGATSTCQNSSNSGIYLGSDTALNFLFGQASTTCTFYDKNHITKVNARESDGSPTSAGSTDYAYTVNVSSTGLVNATNTEISSLSNPQGTCGEAVAYVLAKDDYGNTMEYSVGEVIMSFHTGSANSGALLTVTDYNNGMYIGKYTATASGTDILRAQVYSACELDGKVVNHNASSDFYDVNYNEADCNSRKISRTCNDGVLSGDPSYQYATCSPGPEKSCYRDGAVVVNGDTKVFYASRAMNSCVCGGIYVTSYSCLYNYQTLRCDDGILVDDETGEPSDYFYSTCELIPCEPCVNRKEAMRR